LGWLNFNEETSQELIRPINPPWEANNSRINKGKFAHLLTKIRKNNGGSQTRGNIKEKVGKKWNNNYPRI